ncbi:major capsid family protein [Paraburkholderia caribensis]|uniref:major capsid family protein n=1 Tax=Paraburkholderia caribensis TaxID=75105 RepID=UPI001D0628A8|nr:major capsid family protein [Paraburkholderia caribensis]
MKLDQLSQYGIHLTPGAELLDEPTLTKLVAAMDAAGPLVTPPNNGIPAMLTNYFDPRVIEILVSPMKSELLYSAVQKGDWATDTATFMTVESTGETATYGDYSENGMSSHNANFPQRQNYGFQTNTQWGDKQMAKAAKARLDYAQRQQIASALILRKKENAINLFGVSGLQNYGLTNDPSLIAPVAPTTGAGGNTWAQKTSDEIYADFVLLWADLIAQGNGLIDTETEVKVGIPNVVSQNLTKQNQYGQVLKDRLKLAYPNMTIVTIPEFATVGGNLVQMIAVEIEGQPTGELGYAERMRAHGVVRHSSYYSEKKSGHNWGAIIYRPIFIAQMLGV